MYNSNSIRTLCGNGPSCMTLNPQINIIKSHHKEALLCTITQWGFFCSLKPSLHDTKSTSCKRHVVMGIYVFENYNFVIDPMAMSQTGSQT